MIKTLKIYAVSLLVLTSYGLSMADEIRKEEVKTIAFKAGGTIRLSTNEGDINIESWDREEVQIRMIKRVWGRNRQEAEDMLEGIEVAIRKSPGRLVIREIAPDGPRRISILKIFNKELWNWRSPVVDFELKVPRNINMRIKGDEGDVELYNLEGKFSIDVDEGNVYLDKLQLENLDLRLDEGDAELKDCNQKTTGLVKIYTDEGRIVLDSGTFDELDLAADEGDIIIRESKIHRLWISADEGDIDAAFSPMNDGSYRIEVDEGDVDIALPASVSLKIYLYADEGHIDNSFNLRLSESDDGEKIDGRIGKGNNGHLKVVTEEGDIYIGKI
ncbi:DUF4097 family beta strand repeat protein [bacterium]|nr:DUF4097 family beta strand repeat protein [bacterium]